MAYTMSENEREKVIDELRRQLATVSERIEDFIPRSCIIDGSDITIELAGDAPPKVTTYFKHLA